MDPVSVVIFLMSGVMTLVVVGLLCFLGWTKISQSYEELDPYNYDFREHAEPVAYGRNCCYNGNDHLSRWGDYCSCACHREDQHDHS